MRFRWVLPVLLLLTSCTHSSSSDADGSRLAVLRSDPLLHGAKIGTSQSGAEQNGGRGYRRTTVSATLLHGSPDATGFRRQVTTALNRMGTGGWTTYYFSCTPDSHWTAYAYRLAHGVSYWASLTASWSGPANARTGAQPRLGLTVRAPESHEHANLFPDQPARVAVGCTAAVRRGPAIVVQPVLFPQDKGQPPAPHGLSR